MQIKQFAIFGERLESVGEAFRDEKGEKVVLAENNAVPIEVGGGIGTDVHRDVEDLAAEAGDNFSFCVGRILKMKSAHGSFFTGQTMVDLQKGLACEQWRKFVGTKNPFQKSTLIAERFSFQDFQSGERCILHIEPFGHVGRMD